MTSDPPGPKTEYSILNLIAGLSLILFDTVRRTLVLDKTMHLIQQLFFPVFVQLSQDINPDEFLNS